MPLLYMPNLTELSMDVNVNVNLERCLSNFSKFDEFFDFNLSRNQFKNSYIVNKIRNVRFAAERNLIFV